jgi:uncharacterized RDD family membrane protein YckC
LRFARLFIPLLLLIGPIASTSADDIEPTLERVFVNAAGSSELVTVSRILPSPDDATRPTHETVIRRRLPGSNDWQVVARYPRLARAVATLGDREIAILLDPGLSADTATRSSLPDLRILTFAVGRPALSDPAFDPRARPVETRLPPPEGVRLLDLAVAPVDSTGPALHALSDQGRLYRSTNQGWQEVADVPPGIGPASADLAGGDVITLAGELGGEVRIWVHVDDQWLAVGTTTGEMLTLVDGLSPLLGGPVVLVRQERGQALVRLAQADPRTSAVTWRVDEDILPGSASAALLSGAIRVVQIAVPADPPADDERGGLLLRQSFDPISLEELSPEASHVLDLGVGGAGRIGGAMPLLLYGLLVLAAAGMLRKPAPATAGSVDVKASLAPLSLRALAGMFDALPLAFVFSLLAASGDQMTQPGRYLLLTVGIVTYVMLPLVGELAAGRSPGKAVLGLQVVRSSDGTPAGGAATVARNLLRPLDLVLGGASLWFTPLRQRVGDIAGGTTVVITRPATEEAGDT